MPFSYPTDDSEDPALEFLGISQLPVSVACFLATMGMDAYAPVLSNEGYDDMKYLCTIDPGELTLAGVPDHGADVLIKVTMD